MDKPGWRIVPTRRQNGNDFRQNGARAGRLVVIADGAKSAVMTMVVRRRRLAVIAHPRLADFARHGDGCAGVAARKSDPPIYREDEGKGLQQEQASDGARDEFARLLSCCYPPHLPHEFNR